MIVPHIIAPFTTPSLDTSTPRLGPGPGHLRFEEPTCRSKSVCSNRGPDMATARGRWLRDQMSARFGACSMTAVETGLPAGTCGVLVSAAVAALVVVVEEVEEEAASNWRGVALNVRLESCRAMAAARRREAYIVVRWLWVGDRWWWFRDRDPEVKCQFTEAQGSIQWAQSNCFAGCLTAQALGGAG